MGFLVKGERVMTEGQKTDLLIKVSTQTEQIHKAIFGNGQKGLIDRVTVIETQQLNCPARNRSWGKIAGLALAAGTFGVALGTALIKGLIFIL